MGFHRVAQRQLTMDAVDIASADSVAFQYTAGFQFRDDFLNRSFRNADGFHHVTQPHSRVFRKA